jgi:hypothetical protein
MRFAGLVLALSFVVSGLAPATAQAQNQLQLGKDLNVSTRQVSDHWLKIDYDPADRRRGAPGDELPPGIDRDVETRPAISPDGAVVDPGNEMVVETRKAKDFQFDTKQDRSKTTGGLPPGIERDTDASGAAVTNGVDLLGADRSVRSRKSDDVRKPILRPAYDRASPVSMGSSVRTAPRENAVRGLRGYKANRWE